MSQHYDSACYDLAALFLEPEEDATEIDRITLARAIQNAIEAWFWIWEDEKRCGYRKE